MKLLNPSDFFWTVGENKEYPGYFTIYCGGETVKEFDDIGYSPSALKRICEAHNRSFISYFTKCNDASYYSTQ